MSMLSFLSCPFSKMHFLWWRSFLPWWTFLLNVCSPSCFMFMFAAAGAAGAAGPAGTGSPWTGFKNNLDCIFQNNRFWYPCSATFWCKYHRIQIADSGDTESGWASSSSCISILSSSWTPDFCFEKVIVVLHQRKVLRSSDLFTLQQRSSLFFQMFNAFHAFHQ